MNLSHAPSRDDPGFESVPRFLDVAGVEIQWVEDIGPYGKLLPTLEHVGDEDLIVTADDDLLYAPTWLESLRNEALRNPTAVIAARARTMAPTPWGGWRNYRLWPPVTQDAVGHMLLPLGAAGTVYRKPLLDLEFLTDRAFLDMAPRNDDLWYRVASLRRGVPVAVRPGIDATSTYLQHSIGLWNRHNKPSYDSLGFPLGRAWARIRSGVADRLGFNETANDVAWDAILAYAGRPAVLR